VVIERVFFLCARAELPLSLKTGRQLLNNFPALRFESPFGDIITENLFSYQLLHCLISRNAIILLRLSDSLSTTDLI
jgi:hypothetical protein